jgi:hypothetical protein
MPSALSGIIGPGAGSGGQQTTDVNPFEVTQYASRDWACLETLVIIRTWFFLHMFSPLSLASTAVAALQIDFQGVGDER